MSLAFSDDIALANDIVSELNTRAADAPENSARALAGEWLLDFQAVRTWLPQWSLREGALKSLQVSVNPWIDPAGELTERDELWQTWPVDITFCQQLGQLTLNQVDQLADVVEQVRRFLVPQQFLLSDGRKFHSLAYEYLARFDPAELSRVTSEIGADAYAGIFLSAFRVQFRQLT